MTPNFCLLLNLIFFFFLDTVCSQEALTPSCDIQSGKKASAELTVSCRNQLRMAMEQKTSRFLSDPELQDYLPTQSNTRRTQKWIFQSDTCFNNNNGVCKLRNLFLICKSKQESCTLDTNDPPCSRKELTERRCFVSSELCFR